MLNQIDRLSLNENAQNAEKLLKLLANKHRLLVLCSLVEGEKTAGELENDIAISQSALSQHLAKLRKEALVSSRKEGTKVYYRLISMEANAILSTLYLIFCK